MEGKSHHSTVWALARRQHGVVSRTQLLGLGFSPKAIEHRLRTGRLHRVHQGVYAVGRPTLTRHGQWMAAVLSCGPDAALSHQSAAALWQIRPDRRDTIEVSVAGSSARRTPGIAVRRRPAFSAHDLTMLEGIPVTTPACTLADLATSMPRKELEAAINEADKRALIDPETLRRAVDEMPRRPGAAALRKVLDRRSFRLTRSQLERRFLALAPKAGLSLPETGRKLNGFEVDFYWPHLGLVVETDGLRYHRTPQQQALDRRRDQVHTAAGLTCLRFTHDQIAYEAPYVHATLAAVARRLDAPR